MSLTRDNILKWLDSHDLIPKLLSFLNPEHTSSAQTSAGEFLKALITISANAALNEQPCIGPNSLTRHLVSEKCVDILIDCIIRGGNPLTVAVGVVIEIIRKNNPDYDQESGVSRDAPPTLHDPIYLGTLLRMFAARIPDFMELLLSASRSEIKQGSFKRVGRAQLNTAWGSDIEPLGFDRFKICELLAELLHCSNMELHNEVGSHAFMVHRDTERERLRREGAFVVRSEEEQGYVYPDAADNTLNGGSPSLLESGSPPESKRFDGVHAGDEDGFEDVSSSGEIIEKTKYGSDKRPATDSEQQDAESFTPVSKIGMTDDFVDEPLTPPKPEEPSLAGREQREPADLTLNPPAHSLEPVSPTASGLTDKVGDVSLSNTSDSPNTKAPKAGDHDDTESADWKQSETSAASTSKQNDEAESSSLTLASEAHPDAGHVGTRIRADANGQAVVGDYLKLMFYEHKVVPTIIVGYAPLKLQGPFANFFLCSHFSSVSRGITFSTMSYMTSSSRFLMGLPKRASIDPL
jgi:SIT4-associating protein SAP185/190